MILNVRYNKILECQKQVYIIEFMILFGGKYELGLSTLAGKVQISVTAMRKKQLHNKYIFPFKSDAEV